MNFEKLKETARKYEQKEDWRRAIEVYLKAIQEFESGHDPIPDLAIYNRIGDLYLKANEPASAVQAYERAADLYGEQGLYNNAIALCNKILRVNPGRIQVYLKLAHLHAGKNVVIEAKKNLLEFLDRMNALNQLDDAFKAMKDFADQYPGNKDIRLMLSELLRASSRNEEAREQLEKLASDLEARGDSIGARKTLARLQAIESADAPPTPPGRGDLVFLDTGVQVPPGRRPVARQPAAQAAARKTPPPSTPAPEPEPAIERAPSIEELAREPIEALEIEATAIDSAAIPLEPLQPISEEASMEMTSFDIGKTLGFEPTVADTGLDVPVEPLEGLELDESAAGTADLALSPDGGSLAAEFGIEHSESIDIQLGKVDRAIIRESQQVELVDAGLSPFEEPPALEAGLTGLQLTSEGFGHDLDRELRALPGEPETPHAADSLGLELIEPVEPGATRGRTRISFLGLSEPRQQSIGELEEMVFEDPDNPDTHRALGEALIAGGEKDRGAEELDLALAGYEGREDWERATDLVNELILLDPNGVRHYQKLVELAYRTGDKPRLITAYLELGDALMRAGALDKAVAVYRRVVDHDPANRRAQVALEALEPAEPPVMVPPAPRPERAEKSKPEAQPAAVKPARPPESAPAPPPAAAAAPPPHAPPTRLAPAAVAGDFIDLGAMILEDELPRDTRMKVEKEEQTGDEQKDFNDMLVQFKRGIEENIDAEDFQAHYDLGVAFKEMGLIDEAIAEFQKALRAPEGRLRTSEALGVAFFEKGQYAIAEAILRRAVETLGASDDEQIGLLYWLGRAAEAQQKAGAAIPCYERVLAVNIKFQDVGSRMSRLAAARHQ